MSASHREARDWLAHHVGLPPLGGKGLPREEQEAAEARQHFEHRVLLCLTRLGQLYQEKLLNFPEGLTWLKKQYGFDREVVEKCGLGFCEHRPPLAALRREGFLQEEILGTGAFTPGNSGGSASTLKSHLAGRITFPYLRGNQVIYMAGRCTPWTFRKTQEPPQFKKLWVHHPEKSPWVAPCVNNGWLFNEEVLASNSVKTLVITEGFADCLALEARGIPSLSPATVKFKLTDLARIKSRLREMEKVVLCLDQEFSNVGQRHAMDVALHLRGDGIKALVLELPLESEQQAAWDQLSQEYGLKPGVVREKNQEPGVEQVLDGLEKTAKQDVASYFLHGHEKEEFLELLKKAKHPVEMLVEMLPGQISLDQGKEILFPLVQIIFDLPPVEQAHFEGILKAACKSRSIGVNILRAIFQEVRKEKKPVRGSGQCSDQETLSPLREQANTPQVVESQEEDPILEMGNMAYFLRGAEIWKTVRKKKKTG